MNTVSPSLIASATEAIPASLQDQQAVAAVREGDIARYRELVERYQRRVYAVAWSSLGDAMLAEEATQEAFIRAYRSLPLLGDGAKFAAWISAIARNLSHSLGRRHQRELNRCARWALEQPTVESPASAEEPACTPDMLRQTLAELTPAHRECLVLFYLQDKSGAEAAAMLGIAEPALRVRLMRARAALREKLEARLGQSLEQLRPSSTLTPSVMAAITSTASAKTIGGAGLGTTLMAALGKILPFKLMLLFIPVISMAPGMGMAWWVARADLRNFREVEGFRARRYRHLFGRRVWLILAAIMLFSFVFAKVGIRALGEHAIFLGLGLAYLVMLGVFLRSLRLNRSWFHIGIFINCLCMTVGLLAIGFGWMPVLMFPAAIVLGMVAMIPGMRERPLRMDYNLFLRAAQGLVQDPVGNAWAAATPPKYDRAQLQAFARFLGSRFLALNYRWTESGLQLCLPNVTGVIWHFRQMAAVVFCRWEKNSWIELGWHGTIRAHCSDGDASLLQTMEGPAKASAAALEERVAAAVAFAWSRFRAGDLAAAERSVGEVPDSEVFLTPPSKSKGFRMQAAFMLITAAVLIYSSLKIWRITQTSEEARPVLAQMHNIALQETQETKQIAQLRNQREGTIRQAQDWEAQAQQADPDQAAALRQQAAQLRGQIDQTTNAQIDQIKQLVARQQAEWRQLNQQFNQIMNIPPSSVPPPAPASSPP